MILCVYAFKVFFFFFFFNLQIKCRLFLFKCWIEFYLGIYREVLKCCTWTCGWINISTLVTCNLLGYKGIIIVMDVLTLNTIWCILYHHYINWLPLFCFNSFEVQYVPYSIEWKRMKGIITMSNGKNTHIWVMFLLLWFLWCIFLL